MQAQIDQLLAEQSVPDPVREVFTETQSPFPTSVTSVIPPKNFKMPAILQYNGKTDPVAHVQIYRTWMSIAKADAPTLCNAFPLTLTEPAKLGSGGYKQGRFPALSSSRSSSSLNS